jgi:hypothetical protein
VKTEERQATRTTRGPNEEAATIEDRATIVEDINIDPIKAMQKVFFPNTESQKTIIGARACRT